MNQEQFGQFCEQLKAPLKAKWVIINTDTGEQCAKRITRGVEAVNAGSKRKSVAKAGLTELRRRRGTSIEAPRP